MTLRCPNCDRWNEGFGPRRLGRIPYSFSATGNERWNEREMKCTNCGHLTWTYSNNAKSFVPVIKQFFIWNRHKRPQ
ncbi:MAG: hypothetical protein AABY09_02995 [Nanoarchaeota archaeon]|mgnify:CR=1